MNMYRNILACLDNSDWANSGAALSIELASRSGARLTGCHVYAARLHNSRFLEMEDGLPAEYRKEEKLKETREVHDSLITKGLRIISDSYMAVFLAGAKSAGIEASGVSREGRNFEELVKEIKEGGYDLAVLGRFGLGKTATGVIGSVAERVTRRARIDILLADETPMHGKTIVAAIDGSPASFGGLITALELADIFGRPVEAVSAFDPQFHQAAFRSIAGVLTEEAGRLFRFSEQEKLHDEIIDKGLARIYQGHLDTAQKIARSKGKKIKATLLSGKASDEIIKYARRNPPFMLVLGRTGVHATDGLDIGSTTENCIREAPCHVLVSSKEFLPEPDEKETLEWTDEARGILERIPQFARGIVKGMVDEAARKSGASVVSAALMREVRKKMDK